MIQLLNVKSAILYKVTHFVQLIFCAQRDDLTDYIQF